jgi:porphobilinogen synthase
MSEDEHKHYFNTGSNQSGPSFPSTRMRRNRRTHWSRLLTQENEITVNDLIWPVFVREGENIEEPISSMPGVFRYSIDRLISAVDQAKNLGIPLIALFPHVGPEFKDSQGSIAIQKDNLICRAIEKIKSNHPEIGIQCDVALDPYTDHGHDGVIGSDGNILNDATVNILCKQALAQAAAGCDIISPSDMMDGRIGAIRKALDTNDYSHVQIMSYAAKYASGFYGPFREAVGSASTLGTATKATYQMDPGNTDEALREVALDIAEGADMIMIKPGLPYLDIIRRVTDQFGVPTYGYQVSGEYSMIKAAVLNGWLEADKCMMESLISFKRAGASGILTYFAVEAAKLIRKRNS